MGTSSSLASVRFSASVGTFGAHRKEAASGALTTAYHDGKYTRELAGHGSLELESDPSGAEVWLHDFVEERLVMQPRNARLLGVTPLSRTALPMGSYLVVLKKEGFRDTRYPVFISRNKEWTGKVTLFTDEEIGEGFVHVPAGLFIVGGDPECLGWDSPCAESWVDDFFAAEHPVTNSEYLEFLNDLVAEEGLEAAKSQSPGRVPDAPKTSCLVEANGRLTLPSMDAERGCRLPGHPVVGVSWQNALAYCRWRTFKEGREVTLPAEVAWEKMARGVDGRWFPWGNRFDPSCCNMAESCAPGSRGLVTVGEMHERFPADCSPYLIRGLGGNVREWTLSHGDRIPGSRVVRGGCWTLHQLVARCAFRNMDAPLFVDDHLGFRVVASPRRTRA